MIPTQCCKVDCTFLHRRKAEVACSTDAYTSDVRHAAGLLSLRLRLQKPDADRVRVDFIQLKHGHDALERVWDAQSLV